MVIVLLLLIFLVAGTSTLAFRLFLVLKRRDKELTQLRQDVTRLEEFYSKYELLREAGRRSHRKIKEADSDTQRATAVADVVDNWNAGVRQQPNPPTTTAPPAPQAKS